MASGITQYHRKKKEIKNNGKSKGYLLTFPKLYKKHFASFTENRSITLQTKLSILIPVSAMLILACLMINLLVMRITIIALLLLKYWYFICIYSARFYAKSLLSGLSSKKNKKLVFHSFK